LEVRAGGGWVGVSAPKLRALLAVLVLRPGQVVSTGQLIDELWGNGPPAAARKLVSGYVLRVRRVIGDPDGQVLVTRAPGYRLVVAPGEVDVSRFEELAAAGRRALAGGDGERAAESLGQALALWRGQALADVPRGPLIAAEAARLEELRLGAAELQVEAGICCGRGSELVAELRQMTAEYPLRERFWHQLMRVLEHSGRPAEALEAYARVRRVLADELGADPGPSLQQLHHRLLKGDPAPHARPSDGRRLPAPAAATPTVLRQLPGTARHFVGRAAELAALTGLLHRPGPEVPGMVMISAIDGMPGVGKTALAVQAGHVAADRFPDRQLFVDLHGHTPGQQPADPADVLAGLLAADGVDPRYLPAGLELRAAMWRDRMAGHRVLLILDNAASTAQVTPLLPGTSSSLVIVTSRRFLGDLDAAAEVLLDVPPPADARAMFTSLAPRAVGEPAEVTELVALCGYLPLAIVLLARHQSWTTTDLIAGTRARLLTVTAENHTIAAAFELSYQDLGAGQQRFFRYLGLHPGDAIDAYGAASLAGLPLDQAAAHLDALHGRRLLEEPVPRRYRMHSLIRQYSRDLAARSAGQEAREHEQATGRLLDYYQHTAEAADAHLARHARPPSAAPAAVPAAVPGLPSREQAQAWMAAERANLTSCIAFAAGRGHHARVVSLTAAIASHLRSDGPWPLAVTLHTAAAAAARSRGDQPGHANALLNLSDVLQLTGNHPGAAGLLEQARDIYRDLGSRLGEANALFCLGDAGRLAGDFVGANSFLVQALAIYREIGSRLGEGNTLRNLGTVREMTGDYPVAASLLEQSLDIFRRIGYQLGEADALLYLGAIRQETSNYAGATGVLEQARNISGNIGYRLGEANAMLYLGAVWQETGDYPGSASLLAQARDIYRGAGSLLGEANTLLYLGVIRQETGDYPGAASLLEQARDIYRDISSPLGEANAQCRLGTVKRLTGDYLGAANLLGHALGSYRSIGDRLGESLALIETGALHLSRGDPHRARTHYQHALRLARVLGSQLGEARALEGIGKTATATPAGSHPLPLRQALEIYRRIGAANANRLAAEMRSPPDSPVPMVLRSGQD
jgi:DNA-binding SARP family transcriptional activator/tetratricopeptide (TPR) repeat protein